MAISVDKLLKVYKSGKGAYVCALKDISFNLPDTGMVFILGKSGCGKSTLLNILGGLDGFDGGEIVIDGKSIKDYKPRDLDGYRNDYVGFVFQENNLLDKKSVRRNVGLALDLQSARDTEGKVDGALESVGLKDLSEKKCNCLSGGQKQRVAIARALIKQPKLLLCDEPTGALDSETGEDIFTLLKELSSERLVVVVSHDRESAEKYGDRVIELKYGEIITDSAPLDIAIPANTEEKSEKENAKEKKHGGLRFARAFTLGVHYIAARPIRMAICFLLCFVTFAFVGITDAVNAYDRDKAMLYTMEKSGTTFYAFSKGYIDGNRKIDVVNYGMTEAEAEELISLLDVNRTDYIYVLAPMGKMFIREVTGVNCDDNRDNDNNLLDYSWLWGYVEADESFLNDYRFPLVAGGLPESTGEVVIPVYLYNFFKAYGYDLFDEDGKLTGKVEINSYEDLLGKTLSLYNSLPPLKIKGIIDTNFIYSDQADVLFNVAPEYDYKSFVKNMHCIEEDVIHNTIFVRRGFNAYYKENDFGNFDRMGDNAPSAKRIMAPFTGSDTQKLKNIRIYTTQYGGRRVNLDKENSYCYHLANYSEEQIRTVEENNTLNILRKFAVYISIGTVAISSLFLIYYASGTINERRREIGILRALGASRLDMGKIVVCEYGIFTTVTLAVSLIISGVCVAVLDNSLTSGYGVATTFIKFGIRQVAVIVAVAILAVVVGVAFPLYKLLKKKPVDVIADRK